MDEMESIESLLFDHEEEDWSKEYGGISEFIADLGKEADLVSRALKRGYVLFEKHPQQPQQQLHDQEADLECEAVKWGYVLFEKHPQHPPQQLHLRQFLTTLSPFNIYVGLPYLVQFWGVTKVEGSHHYLSTKHQPFLVYCPNKGFSSYRELCRNHVYDVDVQGRRGDNRNIGGVGRAYRNNHLESTPDLRLYSNNQFPMRDEAARCGFRYYFAIPLFDSHTNQSYGVLEILQSRTYLPSMFFKLDEALQIAGLRSTHNFVSTSDSPPQMQLESEIKEILEFIVDTIPGLYSAQVWVPCQHCVKNSANLGCMGMSYPIVSSWLRQLVLAGLLYHVDVDVQKYFEACKFHNLQLDLGSFDSLNISEYPLAHYAHKARFTHSFSISLESLDNSKHSCLVQFFHQPKFRQDAYGDNSLHWLLKIMEMNLKSFKFVLRGQLLEESQKPYAIPRGSMKSLKEMKFYKQKLWEYEFIKYLKTDSYFHRPSSKDLDYIKKWRVLCSPADGDLVYIPVKEKIKTFMKNVGVHHWVDEYRIIQFWVPKMDENRCYLETSDQPYAVGCLAKGLASYRNKCVTHQYVVDEEAKEEELGPPGRVFKSRQPEVTPDLFHYTTKEFPIRNYAMHCCTRPYFALPIFDDRQNHKCVGVMEFLGFSHYELEHIRGKLEDAELCSSRIGFHPGFLYFDQPPNTLCCRKFALLQLKDALNLMSNSVLQIYMANVWVPNGECDSITDSNMSYMELEYSTNNLRNDFSPGQGFWIHVQARKGMIGMVLASENKSSFCQNLCGFGIADQPQLHFEMSERCNVCFAICLQSSETDDLYVVEFFLYPGPAPYENLRSFLNFLFPIMKDKLKSFKLACGKQLGEGLVIEVIEFSEANKLVSFESEQPEVFPFKFKSVQYPRKGHPPTEEQQTEEHIVAASDLNRRERGKRKTGLHLNLEALKPHFGKKLIDVAEELGVGRSTIKRACRDYGIDRWPSKQKYNKNPSLFERGREMQSSTSNLQPVEKVTESSDHVVALEEAEEKVIVKVRYEEDIIKFDSCVSLRLTTLIEEVATRLNLEKGSFKLKYLDEDGDEILLTIDKDLQDCPKSRTATGKTCIQLFVRR